LLVALAGLVVGFVVGLTGMGGGALMTPMLVLFFGIQPLAAVSSDLVASLVMKPVGGAVHLRRGTVHKELVRWLVIGSVPSAFCGVLLLRAVGKGSAVQDTVKLSLGVALLVAVAMMVFKALLSVRRRVRLGPEGESNEPIQVRKALTVTIGVLGGLIVGMTSVGSGSLIIVTLLALYPALKANQLVGTDLLQAVPLVWAAALGHILFGDFKLEVTAALLAGSIPGVIIGSLVSARAPGGLIRRILAFVLLASALKMFDVGNVAMVLILVAVGAGAGLAWMLLRVAHGLRPLSVLERPLADGTDTRE
jgi:hypothetical protein